MPFRLLAFLLFLFSCVIYSHFSEARSTTSVKGHVKKGGKYVPPYKRTSPNKSKLDNYGTKGNVNPYNGNEGTADPLKPGARLPRSQP
jgi:hypothetical protein